MESVAGNSPDVDPALSAKHGRIDLRANLLAEVNLIVSVGPQLLASPSHIPVLAELALGPDGDPNACHDFTSGTLRSALKDIGDHGKLSGHEIAAALAELLGIGTTTPDNQNERFDNAANKLWTYANGESLRQTRWQWGNTKQLVYKIFLGLLVDALVAFAAEIDFRFTGRFLTQRQPPPRDVRMSVEKMNEAVHYLTDMELLTAMGGDVATYCTLHPNDLLIALAEAVYPTGGTLSEKVEALLTWAISNRFPGSWHYGGDWEQRQQAAIKDLARLGKERDLSDRECLERAAPVLMHKVQKFTRQELLGVAQKVGAELAIPLVELAIEEGML